MGVDPFQRLGNSSSRAHNSRPQKPNMLDQFRLAFKAADLAVAGSRCEEDRCVDTLKKLKTAEFPREILLKSDVGSRLSKLEDTHPSRNIQLASKAVLDAMTSRLYSAKKLPVKKPPMSQISKETPLPQISKKTESGPISKKTATVPESNSTDKNKNAFELFQRALKASSSGGRREEEERCVDGFKQLVKELPDDIELLLYMGQRLMKIEENHSSPAVRKLSTDVLQGIRHCLYHMKTTTAIRPEIKRIQKSNTRLNARPRLYVPVVESY